MLVHATIKADLISALNSITFDENSTDLEIKTAYADVVATWLISVIQSADLTIPTGTIITTGSAATQTQSVPGIVTGGLS